MKLRAELAHAKEEERRVQQKARSEVHVLEKSTAALQGLVATREMTIREKDAEVRVLFGLAAWSLGRLRLARRVLVALLD